MQHDEVAKWAAANEDRIFEAVERDDQVGFCVACGAEAGNHVEPDAENFECFECGRRAVFGAEQLIFYMTMRGDDE